MNEDRITVEKLSKICRDATWEHFEAMSDGRLLIMDTAQTMLPVEEEIDPRLWVFEMRVGIHLGKPTQAIMSCGHFIRIRRDGRWENMLKDLKVLDATNPQACLYHGVSHYTSIAHWNPMVLYQVGQAAGQLAAQNVSQQYGYYGQYGGGLSAPTGIAPGNSVYTTPSYTTIYTTPNYTTVWPSIVSNNTAGGTAGGTAGVISTYSPLPKYP